MIKKSFLILISLFLSSQIFAATMSSRVRQVPKQIQDGIFVNPKDNIVPLVKFLAGTSGDTSSRVKILHDWICDNIAYDCDVFTEEGAGAQGYETVLKKRKAVCVGYANLMAVMCQLANIESEIVYGWSKGFNYPGYLRPESDHAWNAVKIAGKWKLIDVTWDAGFVERRTFIKRYTTQWYNLKPEQFIYSHLPEEKEWQLLGEKQIRTSERFEKEPYIPGVFFEYGLSFGKDAPSYTNLIHGETGFDFSSSKNGVSLSAGIYGESDGADLSRASYFENAGRNKRFLFDVPDKKVYTVRVGARINGVTSNPYYFSRADFEQKVLAKAQELLAEKKITKNEADLFVKSYYLVAENDRYYYAEDLFDNGRNMANSKILKLLERNTSRYENVLSFEVRAADDYAGFGADGARFPQLYLGYQTAQNIKLVSPLQGTLQKGSEQHFAVSTSAYSKLAFVLGESDFVFLTKNPKTGAFELDYTVPGDIDVLHLFASKDGTQFASLISWDIRD